MWTGLRSEPTEANPVRTVFRVTLGLLITIIVVQFVYWGFLSYLLVQVSALKRENERLQIQVDEWFDINERNINKELDGHEVRIEALENRDE